MCILKKWERVGDIIKQFVWQQVNVRLCLVLLVIHLSRGESFPLNIFYILLLNNLVHPSYKSQTAIRITRKSIAPLQVPSKRTQQQNPYVYKPKSYSKKRIFTQSSGSAYTPPPLTKKIKPTANSQKRSNPQNILDMKFITQKLHKDGAPYFPDSFMQNEKMQIEQKFQLPLKIQISHKSNKNAQLSNKIQIVSTDNNKLLISIHEGLLKANQNHSKQQQSLEGIVNPFNSKLKNHFSQKINFIKDYKSGYTPIELQNKSKKDDENGGYQQNKKTATKSHFIKKKQSTLSLARTCGVSYIKPSQSIQGHPYQPLPPLIFQCSTSCNYNNELKNIYQDYMRQLIDYSQNRWLPAIMTNQQHMRDLLLGKPHGKVIWVNGLINLWPLFNEGIFLLILFHEQQAKTQEQVWLQFNTCYWKFGILAKKSTSGKKLFLKSIQPQISDKQQTISLKSVETLSQKIRSQQFSAKKQQALNENLIQNEDIKQIQQKKMDDSPPQQRKQCKDVCQQFMKQLKNSRTVITMSLKFEMYLHEYQWKGLKSQQKNLLNAIIHSFQQHLQKKTIQVIKDRLQLSSHQLRQQLLNNAVQKLRIGSKIDNFKSAQTIIDPIKFNFNSLKSLILSLKSRQNQKYGCQLSTIQIFKDKDGKQNLSLWEKHIKMPIYYISTRDSFAFDLIQNITLLKRGDRTYKKIVYHFQHDNYPQNFHDYKKLFPNLQVGVTSYHDFFTEQQLKEFESKTLETQKSAFKNKFLQMTVQPTIVGSRIKRTKFFFGYRYMWTRCQLAEPTSYVGAGVRRDVTPAPKWLKKIEDPMVEHQILEPNFLNSVAINVYHDGSEGLAQHFDDAVRFKQPIYTLRLVSDGRLSFGSQFYGFCNGAFIIPLPRGCICRMQENSYAANGVKHCVRPCDMSGKSAAVILRQMHHQVVSQAARYDQLIDFPAWLSTLSEDPKAITFAEQKRREAQQILADEQSRKQKLRATNVMVPEVL